MRIVFFGTPSFAADILTFLLKNHAQIVGVISRPDKPHGRCRQTIKGPVRVVAESASIPHFQPEKVSSTDFIPVLESFKADLFIVVAYGEILTQAVLDIPKLACLNIHASLLPKYRGAAPIQRAIINGENESGITIMHMVRRMDAGAIISQRFIPILPEMTYGELELEMRIIGAEAILDVVHSFEKGKVESIAQNENEVTFAPKIELEDCEIHWDNSSYAIHNLIRGVNPEPGAWCHIMISGHKKRLKIYTSRISGPCDLKPSECKKVGRSILVGCGSGVLELLEVQLEGKKRMNAEDLYRGLPQGQWEIF